MFQFAKQHALLTFDVTYIKGRRTLRIYTMDERTIKWIAGDTILMQIFLRSEVKQKLLGNAINEEKDFFLSLQKIRDS